MSDTAQILPGSTICILGAGQLGKMTLQAAHRMGYHTAVWSPDGDIPAMEMATHRIVAPHDDTEAFETASKVSDVVTTEWENIPVGLLQKFEERGVPVRPSSRVLSVAQSRLAEKTLAGHLTIPHTPICFLPKETRILTDVVEDHFPGILKTDRMGYDGQGQVPVENDEDLLGAFGKMGQDAILEKLVDIDFEISVLVARTPAGAIRTSPCMRNVHSEGILRKSSPLLRKADKATLKKKATMIDRVSLRARTLAEKVAKRLELEGVLVIEFFVSSDGELLFNEMAPRPHNSFHGSIEASFTSQFEQHVRSICNLPLGHLDFSVDFEMVNLIGGDWDTWAPHLVNPRARLHVYGKRDSRPRRKMGHVTTLKL